MSIEPVGLVGSQAVLLDLETYLSSKYTGCISQGSPSVGGRDSQQSPACVRLHSTSRRYRDLLVHPTFSHPLCMNCQHNRTLRILVLRNILFPFPSHDRYIVVCICGLLASMGKSRRTTRTHTQDCASVGSLVKVLQCVQNAKYLQPGPKPSPID